MNLPRIYLARQAVRGVARLQGDDCRISCRGQIQNGDPLGQSKPFPQVPKRHFRNSSQAINSENSPPSPHGQRSSTRHLQYLGHMNISAFFRESRCALGLHGDHTKRRELSGRRPGMNVTNLVLLEFWAVV